MDNAITIEVVIGSYIVPKVTILERRGEVFVVIKHMLGRIKSDICPIVQIRDDLRKVVLTAAARSIANLDQAPSKCATVSIDCNVENPELTVRIWNPKRFDSNFDTNFESMLTTISQLIRHR